MCKKAQIPKAVAKFTSDLQESLAPWSRGDPSEEGEAERLKLIKRCLVYAFGEKSTEAKLWRSFDFSTKSETLKSPQFSSREEYVFGLWTSIFGGDGVNKEIKKHLAAELMTPDTLKRTFFLWFLRRFDIARAIAIHGGRRPVFSQIMLVPLIVAWSTFCLLQDFGALSQYLLGLAGFLALTVGDWYLLRRLGSNISPFSFVWAMLPRLGAGVGVGYLFLFAAPNLVFAISLKAWAVWEWLCLIVTTVLVLVVVLTSLASRRIDPFPRNSRDIVLRALHVLALAILYAAAGLPLLSPMLFYCGFLGETVTPGFPQYLICSMIALTFGTLLQLVWEEKPLTEPF